MMWHHCAFPGKLAQLTSADEAERKSTLQHCKYFWQVWAVAKDVDQKQVQAWVRRSCMNWAFVQETLEALARVDFELVPEALHATLVQVFSVPPTNIVENGFNAMRRTESKHQASKTVAQLRKWWATIGEQTLRVRADYREVAWGPVQVRRAEVPSKLAPLFYPPTAPGTTSCNLRSIVSTKQQGDWATTTPQSYSGLAAEMSMVCYCYEHDRKWELGETAWLSQVLVPGMLVRRRGADAWFFIAGSLSSLALGCPKRSP